MDEKSEILKAQNPYDALLLPSTATPEEAKYQYFKLVKRFSPEKEEETFRRIRRAYEELKDPATKAAADVMIFTAPPGRIRFKGVNTTTGSLVKVSKEIQNIEKEAESDPTKKEQLIAFLKERAILAGKHKKWTQCLKDLDDLEKLGVDSDEIDQNRVFIFSRIAHEKSKLGAYAEASHRWRRALRMAPDRSDILHNLAVCATLMINRQDEENYWVDTLRTWHQDLSERGDDEYLKHLIVETHKRFGGRFLRQTGDENLRSQIQAAPADTAPHQVEDVGFKSATPTVQRGPSAPPSKTSPAPDTAAGAGMDAYGKKNWTGAISSFEMHLKQNPEDGEIMDKLGWAYLHNNQVNRAFAVWQDMIQKEIDKERAQESLVQAKLETARKLRKRQMINPALAQLKSALKIVPNSSELFRELGDLYSEREDWMNASYYYEKALEANPNEKILRQLFKQAKAKSRSFKAII